MDQCDTGRRNFAEQRATVGELAPHVRLILRALYISRERTVLYWLGIGLVGVISATAYGQIKLNAWNRPFYDALARKDISAFGHQLLVFAVIAGALLILNVAQTWLNQMAKLKLREGLTRDLLTQWLMPKRAFLLAAAGGVPHAAHDTNQLLLWTWRVDESDIPRLRQKKKGET